MCRWGLLWGLGRSRAAHTDGFSIHSMDLLPHKLLTLLSSTLADQFTERQLRQHFEYLGDQFGTIEGSKREKSLAALRHWNSLTHGARERRFRALADIILNSPIPEQYR